MSVMIIYRPVSEHTREVADFLHDFERQTAKKLDEVDPDSSRGAEICRLYDIVEYPAIIATTDDGQLRNMWCGLPLPLIDEVNSYYA